MRYARPVIFAIVVAGALIPAATAYAEKNSGRGSGGGAPAPLIGLTLLGQLGGGAGIYAAWRKRKRKNQDKDPQ